MRHTSLTVSVLSLVVCAPATAQLSGSIDLGGVGSAVRGAVFRGESLGARAGRSIVGGLDANGDGIPDIAIGAPMTGSGQDGRAYLLFGDAYVGYVSLAEVGPVPLPGVLFTGEHMAQGLAGFTISGGDVNADGYDDLLIGAYAIGFGAGRSYLWYGSASPGAALDLAGADVRLEGFQERSFSGRSVSVAGDVDGDGYADLLIGSPYYNGFGRPDVGETYLVYGAGDLADQIDLASADARFVGEESSDESGWSVAGVGDVNGDGFGDIVISAPEVNGVGTCKGAYLIYGGSGTRRLGGRIDLAEVGRSISGALFQCAHDSDLAGVCVGPAGDVNGDGLADFVIGAAGAEQGSGLVYLIYGAAGEYEYRGIISLDDISGDLGVTLRGGRPDDGSGFCVCGAGDVDGDGYDDILIGAIGADNLGIDNAGSVRLIYGNIPPTSGDLDILRTDTNALRGAVFKGAATGDAAGASVAMAGDLDGDGAMDFLIGAPGVDAGSLTDTGAVYLIYGVATGGATYDPRQFTWADYAELFLRHDRRADLDNDGSVDAGDLFLFLDAVDR